MNRAENLEIVRERSDPWDLVIIGGGATGAGCALDAASRGFSVLLLEQHDFGKGTSSRSTKLIHGGVRYLRQGNIALVREALRERSNLLKNAPHVVETREFVIPCYSLWQKSFYGAGMKVYDLLAGRNRIGASRMLTREETLGRLPGIRSDGLSGGVLYHDGQFDDTRLLIDVLRTAAMHGAVVLNYAKVRTLDTDAAGRLSYVGFEDGLSGERNGVAARAVINATGIFSDAVRRIQNDRAEKNLSFAQGIHLVFDRKFLPSNDGLMIPKTSDGRVLFCIPWQEHLLVGTTDTPVDKAELEPHALDAEVDLVLDNIGRLLVDRPTRPDILSVFAGIRPLIRKSGVSRTSELSRGHQLFVEPSGLVTITGGKWTTFRKMAEDAVDAGITAADLEKRPCTTQSLRIEPPAPLDGGECLHAALQITRGSVVRAVREEMACSIEDVLARRDRSLFVNANAAIEVAPAVAKIMNNELGLGDQWVEGQLNDFRAVAEHYIVRETGPPSGKG